MFYLRYCCEILQLPAKISKNMEISKKNVFNILNNNKNKFNNNIQEYNH